MKGLALSLKDEYLSPQGFEKLLQIFDDVKKPAKFLQGPCVLTGQDASLNFLVDENAELAFVKSINQSLIKDWDHFEFLLCFLVENRFIRIYASFLQHQITIET